MLIGSGRVWQFDQIAYLVFLYVQFHWILFHEVCQSILDKHFLLFWVGWQIIWNLKNTSTSIEMNFVDNRHKVLIKALKWKFEGCFKV